MLGVQWRDVLFQYEVKSEIICRCCGFLEIHIFCCDPQQSWLHKGGVEGIGPNGFVPGPHLVSSPKSNHHIAIQGHVYTKRCLIILQQTCSKA